MGQRRQWTKGGQGLGWSWLARLLTAPQHSGKAQPDLPGRLSLTPASSDKFQAVFKD
jgi:hypothetical protein